MILVSCVRSTAGDVVLCDCSSQMAMRGTASGVSRAKAEFDARAAGNAACDAKFLTSKILRNLQE